MADTTSESLEQSHISPDPKVVAELLHSASEAAQRQTLALVARRLLDLADIHDDTIPEVSAAYGAGYVAGLEAAALALRQIEYDITFVEVVTDESQTPINATAQVPPQPAHRV